MMEMSVLVYISILCVNRDTILDLLDCWSEVLMNARVWCQKATSTEEVDMII
jgi:hypothetical protein